MGHHTFESAHAAGLEDPERYSLCSSEELLWMLDVSPEATVLDLGSGTGFFTRDVDSFVDRLLAVDIQPVMHQHHREQGVPPVTSLVAADAGSLPLATASATAAYSTVTYHEYGSVAVLEEINRVLRDGGRHVVVDWSANGIGEEGPPLSERYSLEEAIAHHRDAGFEVTFQAERPRTFALVATA